MLDCERCHKPQIQLVRRIAMNGANQVYWHCFNCDRPASKNGSNIAHSELHKYGIESIEELQVIKDYRDESIKCAVEGCDSNSVEWQHWAPKHLFPQDFERWPQDYLCIEHHIEWHNKVTPNMCKVFHCPVCGHEIHESRVMDTDKPGYPENEFWGVAGNRWIKCQSGAHFHFRAGRFHRYAYLKRKAEGGQGVLV